MDNEKQGNMHGVLTQDEISVLLSSQLSMVEYMAWLEERDKAREQWEKEKGSKGSKIPRILSQDLTKEILSGKISVAEMLGIPKEEVEKEEQRKATILEQEKKDDARISEILAKRGMVMPDFGSMTDEQYDARNEVTFAWTIQEKEEAFRKLFSAYHLDDGMELSDEELKFLMDGQEEFFNKKSQFD